MPSTYTLISSNVLSSSAASVTFSAIPSTYTDLVIRASARDSGTGGSAIFVRVNGLTSNIYSVTRLRGTGSSASSGSTTNATSLYFGFIDDATDTANSFGSWEAYFPNYLVAQNHPVSGFATPESNVTSPVNMDINAGLISDTSAITSITLTPNGLGFVSGSSFYLYGIKNS